MLARLAKHAHAIYREEVAIGATLVFTASFLLFSWLLASPFFPDPDSFYHARVALELAHGNLIHQFSWLPHTILARSFADLAFLYHVFLIPFVRLFDPLLGIKFAHALVGGGLGLTLYLVLRSTRVPLPALFVLLLFASNPFLFRAGLVKAPLLALMLLVTGIFFITQNSSRWRTHGLLAVSFLYVWAYGGWPLLIAAALAFVVATTIRTAIQAVLRTRVNPKSKAQMSNQIPASPAGRQSSNVKRVFGFWILKLIRNLDFDIWISRVRTEVVPSLKALTAVLLGSTLGLILNPTFPENLRMLWEQGVEIAIRNYQHVIGVGGEWYPYAPLDLLHDARLTATLAVLGIVLFLATFARQSRESIMLLVLAVGAVVLTLKSRRYVEYSIPLTILFAAFSLRDACAHIAWKRELERFASLAWPLPVLMMSFPVLLAGIAFPTLLSDVAKTKNDLASGWRADAYVGASAFIREHTAKNAIVLHSDWDEMPILFYRDPDRRYIAGLDPTFLYLGDRGRYQTWVDITTGKAVPDLFAATTRELEASAVFITKDHTGMESLYRQDEHFRLAYEDDEAWVYLPK